jgi:hypothetical protein
MWKSMMAVMMILAPMNPVSGEVEFKVSPDNYLELRTYHLHHGERALAEPAFTLPGSHARVF